MANIQYIGARYVPKFYENPDDHSTNWKSGVSYEPLTEVTYLDDTYTSRKPVPASVGNPADNPSYWAKTANYNAALQVLQHQVDENTQDITNLYGGEWLHNKKVVVYGDSTSVTFRPSYIDEAGEYAGMILTNRGKTATRMNHGSNSGVALITNDNDLNTFDYVILCYGTNEWQHSESRSELRTDVRAIINAIRSQAPLVGIIFMIPFYSYRNFNNGYPVCHNNAGMTIKEVGECIIETLTEIDVSYINLYERSTCNEYNYTSKLANDSGGIYVHPVDAFQHELAQILLNGIANDKKKFFVPMLNSFDFVSARRNVSYSDITSAASVYSTGGIYQGYMLKFSSAVTSTTKLFKSLTRYQIRGVASDSLSIDIGGDIHFDVTAGDFVCEFTANTNFKAITLTPTNANTIINDFMLYELSDIPDPTLTKRFGAPTSLTGEGTGITLVDTPKLQYTDNGVSLSSFRFEIGSGVSAGTVIVELPSDVIVDHKYIIASTANGDVLLLDAYSNSIKTITPSPTAGRYFFNGLDLTNFNYLNAN